MFFSEEHRYKMFKSLESLEDLITQLQTQIIRDTTMLTSLYFMHDCKYYDYELDRFKYHPKPQGWRKEEILFLEDIIDTQKKNLDVHMYRVAELKRYLNLVE